jgi:hypothetical protein
MVCLSLRPHVWAFGGSIFRNSSVRPIGRRRARSPLRGLRTAAATGHRRRRRRPVELGCVVVGLAPHCRPAFGADVVVLVAARQDEQELPPRRRGAAALRAEKTGRLELVEAVGPGHTFEFYTAIGPRLVRALRKCRLLSVPDIGAASSVQSPVRCGDPRPGRRRWKTGSECPGRYVTVRLP